MHGLSFLAEQIAASQEGLRSMQLIRFPHHITCSSH
jgi:hypothetical protein